MRHFAPTQYKKPFNNFLSLVLKRSSVSSKILKFVKFVTNNFITLNPQESDTEPHWGKAIFWKRICESCENYFRSTGGLKNHMLDDTREKQFLITNYIILSTLTCNFCDFLA